MLVSIYDKKDNEFKRIDHVKNVFTEELEGKQHIVVRIDHVYYMDVIYYPLERYTLVSVTF